MPSDQGTQDELTDSLQRSSANVSIQSGKPKAESGHKRLFSSAFGLPLFAATTQIV